jgi:hypothetical protein
MQNVRNLREPAEQNSRLTQHKRFAIAHPNFCFAKTSFMLGTLGDMQMKRIYWSCDNNIKEKK